MRSNPRKDAGDTHASETRPVTLVDDHADRLHHLQPRLSRPRELRLCLRCINRDLGIGHGLSSLIGALFFLGYFFFQIPGSIYAERRSVKKLVFVSLIL